MNCGSYRISISHRVTQLVNGSQDLNPGPCSTGAFCPGTHCPAHNAMREASDQGLAEHPLSDTFTDIHFPDNIKKVMAVYI